MTLKEFSSSDEIKSLVDIVTKQGTENHFIENFALLNVSRWIFEGRHTTMRVFAYPSEDPLYVFLVDEVDWQLPLIHVRSPIEGHSRDVCASGIRELLKVLKPSLDKFKAFLTDVDSHVQDIIDQIVVREDKTYKVTVQDNSFAFFMNNDQRKTLLETDLKVQEGFAISEIDCSTECQIIHGAWPHGAPITVSKLRLENFPSQCVRDSNGELAAWILSHDFGQSCHLYAYEKYRGKGIGVLTELAYSQKLIRSGLSVFKYVAVDNTKVLHGTLRHRLWTQWKRQGENVVWSFRIYSKIE